MKDPENTRYGRCEATNRHGERCGRAAIGSHGKCGYHGGKSLRGENHPDTVHGLRSPYLSDEDRRLYENVSQYEPHELILEEFHMTKTRLLRAARNTGGTRGEELAREILDDVPQHSINEDVITALADIMDVSLQALDRQVGRLNQLSKEYRKWTEGETITVEGETDLSDEAKESLDRLSDSLEDVYGDA